MATAKPAKPAAAKMAPAKPNLGDGAQNMLSALAQGHAGNAKRLDAHDGQLEGHTAQLDGHSAQLGEHHDRITALEKAASADKPAAAGDGKSGGG